MESLMRRSLSAIALVAAATLALAGCAGGDETPAATGGGGTGGDELEELVSAAQDEGSLVFYLTPPEATAQQLADAFYDEYGIEAEFVRMTGGELAARYSAEVEAGAPAADLVMPSYDEFIDKGLDEGWLLGLDEADIPGYDEFPEEGKLADGAVAVVQFAPSGLSWNTEALGDLPAPETFEDLADPQYEGKLLLTDPSSSQAYIQFWTMVAEAYGMETVEAIADNAVRLYNSVVPMTEALGAGEGAVTGPNVGQVVAGAAKSGAPVEFTVPDLTNGPEIVLSLSADAQSPNAARLFAHFVLSEAGQDILNAAAGNISAYNFDEMPAEYVRIDRDTALENEQAILDAFGL
ncbi:extracellular solute-binding protein [Microbacterium wangchenii]|uniref:Extracellular solute-binding protein n=2 Tax=Microbacteriaceae TaxID=85023 RepID=A0ABX5SYK7_9MICO|nr:extracellular solute-binding protein [Microbacterium wangchenii]TXK11642.1 extracellular solute-binding protein [Microbacterium wangchenii]